MRKEHDEEGTMRGLSMNGEKNGVINVVLRRLHRRLSEGLNSNNGNTEVHESAAFAVRTEAILLRDVSELRR